MSSSPSIPRTAVVGVLAGLLLTAAGPAYAATGPADGPAPLPLLASIAYAQCTSGGATSADTTIANQLRAQMNGSRLGQSLNAYNVSCARAITATVAGRGLDKRAAVIAITTAITESSLHNYTEAVDYDSLGLFQQRPSQGWGTPAQLTDPVYATNAFLNAMFRKYPNNSWMSGDIGAICQRIQVSAYPDAYRLEVHDAQLLANALWGGGGGTPSKYWVDTNAAAPVFASPTSTTQTGTLNQGTNYVFCKAWGRQIGSGTSYNHWWLKTDPDTGPAGQYVSAYYLSRWGNDEAKDNNGVVIPDCAGGTRPKYWVDTYTAAPVFATPTSTTQTGTLNQGTNYVFCKAWGRQIGSGTSYNHYWLKTDPDTGPAEQYVSAYYLSRWGNDEAKDNNGVVIPNC
ncbi:hypothetical protein SAMN06264365_13025 [Actinoplanes regularis]|uniref:Uncharacterized protein n=1 Tax=Actinoplanes regularis TaxID=52697 RepID=A0A239IQR1_9ACTN|nr:hypothetical protein [Actinoplanes regularis]SNS94764.1 hypothetical protein SAMN06264365_13025 [Actinoplanes regularis]